jgi:hypothetical protein
LLQRENRNHFACKIMFYMFLMSGVIGLENEV